MAAELSIEDLSDLAPGEPWRYTVPKSLFPICKTFLLDNGERAFLDAITPLTPRPLADGYYDVVAQMVGISVELIDDICETDSVMSVFTSQKS